MDPQLARRNIERDSPFAKEIAADAGLEWVEQDRLCLLLRRSVKIDGTAVAFVAKLDCSGYDLAAPSLAFCNPADVSRCGRQWWPRTSNPTENVVTSGEVTGNCVVGFAEYYIFHPSEPRNPKDWRLSKLVWHIRQLLDPAFIQGAGV